jgi:hypothetical protein
MAGDQKSTTIFLVLFGILFLALAGVLIYKYKQGASADTQLTDLASSTGFDRSHIVDTKTVTNPDGTVTTTQTDASGKKLVTTTNKDGSTSAQVQDASGQSLGSKIITTLQKVAPQMAEQIGLQLAMDFTVALGVTMAKNIAAKGVRSGLALTGKIVAREGLEWALRFGGLVSKDLAKQSIQMGMEDAAAKAAAKKAAEGASEAAIKDAALKAAEMAGKEAGEAAIKAAASVGTKAAMMGTEVGMDLEMGPVGVALMAIQLVSMALDIACCGGYCDVHGPEEYAKFRDQCKANYDAGVDDANKQNQADGNTKDVLPKDPIPYGPLDKLDEATRQSKVTDEAKKIINDQNNPIMVPIYTAIKAAIAAGQIKTADDINNYIQKNVDTDTLQDEATKNVCTAAGGKWIPFGQRSVCSFSNKKDCESSFTWPIGESNKTDIYVTWLDDKGYCGQDPVGHTMRTTCEGAKFPYDPVNKTCTITKDYCLQKGMDWNGTKCTLSKGQDIAEMMFGTTMVRGLKQLESKDQYEPCPAGARPAGEIAALAAGACTAFSLGAAAAACIGIGATYIGQTMCAWDKCPDGQQRESGLCYDACRKASDDEKAQGWGDYSSQAVDTPGGKGVVVQGMCYRCPPGYYKSSPGLCQVKLKTDSPGKMSKCPDGFTDSGLFCNVKTRNIGIGKPMKTSGGACHGGGCHTSCPHGLCKTHCDPIHCDPIRTDCPSGTDKIDGLCYSKCNADEFHVPGMPYLCRKGGGPLVQEKMKIGVCDPDKDRVGALCFKKCDQFGGPGWVRTVQGTCRAPHYKGLDVVATTGDDKLSYSRKPLGVSYKVFPKKRKIPFGKGPHGC